MNQQDTAATASQHHLRRAASITNDPADLPLIVKPRRAAAMLDIGLTRLYELLNSGALVSVREGRSRKILVASIHAYVARTFADATESGLGTQQSAAGKRRAASRAAE